MLQLKDVKKSYTTGSFTQTALNGISLNFRESEFVAILGQSGSGKTTALNMIGGLDTYDSGDIIINGKSTKDFKDKDWDAYRNNSIGFIFQSYNLISHLSLIDNVEMGMTLSGVSNSEKRKKALEVLERVGLKNHVNKKPTQLSGGQMQRVAIARALANDPDIILADEPTGALDSKTSVQIMELIQEIAKDKLVIMVTHNPELAEEYATRVVKFQDGQITSDSNPYLAVELTTHYHLKSTSMKFLTALKISFKNIMTKKWRTALTAFASSIGLVGIALILALSTGFGEQIDEVQSDMMAQFPIQINQAPTTMMGGPDGDGLPPLNFGENETTEASSEVTLFRPEDERQEHTNIFSEEFLDYLHSINTDYVSAIGYSYMLNMNIMRDVEGDIRHVNFGVEGTAGFGMASSTFPVSLDENGPSYLETSYELLAGTYPQSMTDVVLIVDEDGRLDAAILENLGFDVEDIKSMDMNDVIGTTFTVVANNNFFQESEFGNFMVNQNLEEAFNGEGNVELTLTGVLRLSPDASMGLLSSGIAYSDALISSLIATEMTSDIVIAQRNADYNVMTLEPMDEVARNNFIATLGGDDTPFNINIHPHNFDTKDGILAHIHAWNDMQTDPANEIVYTDMAAMISDMTGGVLTGITMVLIGFSSISLVVSLIMIAIITYISVMERTKEIGILRALGARKKDITRVFNAETFIIGTLSGAIAIASAYLLSIPLNNVLENFTGMENVAQLNPLHALALVAVSLLLTVLGGLIPARMAAKKDPVEALRSE